MPTRSHWRELFYRVNILVTCRCYKRAFLQPLLTEKKKGEQWKAFLEMLLLIAFISSSSWRCNRALQPPLATRLVSFTRSSFSSSPFTRLLVAASSKTNVIDEQKNRVKIFDKRIANSTGKASWERETSDKKVEKQEEEEEEDSTLSEEEKEETSDQRRRRRRAGEEEQEKEEKIN